MNHNRSGCMYIQDSLTPPSYHRRFVSTDGPWSLTLELTFIPEMSTLTDSKISNLIRSEPYLGFRLSTIGIFTLSPTSLYSFFRYISTSVSNLTTRMFGSLVPNDRWWSWSSVCTLSKRKSYRFSLVGTTTELKPEDRRT